MSSFAWTGGPFAAIVGSGGSGSGGSSYWGDGAANFAALPAGSVVGEVRQTVDNGNLYRWDGAVWQTYFNTSGSLTGPGVSVNNEVALWSGTTGSVLKRATGTGVAHLTSGVLSAANVNMASEVTGVLPVANGGTNSSTALNNNRVIISSGSALVESAAIIASRALTSNASGLPVASATTSTELGYVSGVTSAIQAQLNAKSSARDLSAQWITADGATKTITHNWGSRKIHVEVLDNPNDYATIFPDVTRPTDNTLVLTSTEAPASAWTVLLSEVVN